MKKRLFNLSKTHASSGRVHSNPFRKIRNRKKLSLQKPNRAFVIFGLSCLFLFICIVLYSFPSVLPQFESNTGTIVTPNTTVPSLSLFNSHLKSKNIQFDTMRVATESPTVVVYLSNGGYAYLDLNTPPAPQVDLLSLILSRISSEANPKKLKYVDLRADKPVIKF